MNIRLACQIVSTFNSHDDSRRKNRWAVVSKNGRVFFIRIGDGERSGDPLSLPASCIVGLSRPEAIDAVWQINQKIFDNEPSPSEWAVIVRHPGKELALQDAYPHDDAELIGGAA